MTAYSNTLVIDSNWLPSLCLLVGFLKVLTLVRLLYYYVFIKRKCMVVISEVVVGVFFFLDKERLWKRPWKPYSVPLWKRNLKRLHLNLLSLHFSMVWNQCWSQMREFLCWSEPSTQGCLIWWWMPSSCSLPSQFWNILRTCKYEWNVKHHVI